MTICPSCHSKNPDQNLHCAECGVALDPAQTITEADSLISSPQARTSASESETSIHGRFLPGTKIAGRYRIVSLAGRGGMGEVYRADDLKLQHPVALKFLPQPMKEGSRGFQRFLAEVRLSRQIAHPNVCRVYDIGEVDGQQFLSMEYIDGEDLKGLLRRIGRLPSDKGIEIAQQLCAGLAAAHEKGVMHRDLKPANVMIDGRGQVRITDFGLAQLEDTSSDKREFAGTPAYMAPEQLSRGEATFQSDLYALGLILFEIFTGKAVHQTGSVPELRRLHEESNPTLPSELLEGIDPNIERVILRCLEKDPIHRPKSAQAVAAAFPGGDPLAAAQAAGETPSPEMVAAAGGEGAIDKRIGLMCLAGVAIGLILVCSLAQKTLLIHQEGLNRHPESLADDARRMIQHFGYTNTVAMEAHGFRNTKQGNIRFWYRAFPEQRITSRYWNDWAEASFGRVNLWNPPWELNGELGIELDPNGRLVCFRAIPTSNQSAASHEIHTDWGVWFSKSLTGFDLSGLELMTHEGPPPPDAYDRLQSWKGHDVNGNPLSILATAYGGKPVYFEVIAKGNSELEKGMMGKYRQTNQESLPRQRGQSLILVIYLSLLCTAGIMTWRNFSLGRLDRKGSLRGVIVLFFAGLAAWLFLANHLATGYELPIFSLGSAQVLWKAGFFWLSYTALEPYIRRLWPQFLISWTRLVNGHWRDPLVGQHLLIGTFAGVINVGMMQIKTVAPYWFGLAAQTFTETHPLALDGPLTLVGYILIRFIAAVNHPLFHLLLLLMLRFIFRKKWLVGVVYTILLTTTHLQLSEAHPVIGGIIYGASMSLSLWIYFRFGFLAGIASELAKAILPNIPLTTDLSAWYAENGWMGMALFLAIATFGFYTSQAGRPIFNDMVNDRRKL